MKLIYAQGTCSLAVHILLEEIGQTYEAVRVSLQDKTVLDHYTEKSYVPVLILPSGEKLTEATVILQYLAEHYLRDDLLPPVGTLERARTLEWLTYISTEIHKGMGTPHKIEKRLVLIDEVLARNKYLLDDHLTIADMYCIAILRIADHVGIKLKKFPYIMTYKMMMEEMPLISKVLTEESKSRLALNAA